MPRLSSRKISTEFTSGCCSALKVWQAVVSETETLMVKIRENADALSTCTLESLAQIINEKKTVRKLYYEERYRLDSEMNRVSRSCLLDFIISEIKELIIKWLL